MSGPGFAIVGPPVRCWGSVVRAVERSIRDALRAVPDELRGSPLAKVALNLARRLDSEPADREAVLLARELRMTMAELRQMTPEGGVTDVEAFLARVAAPDLGHTTD
jgi:hypothetical protein